MSTRGPARPPSRAPRADIKDIPLARLQNLGSKSAAMLERAGLTSFEQLRRTGAVAAFAKVRKSEPSASLNLLWALQGALEGLHWTVVAREHRTSLLLALEEYERGG